MKIPKIVALCGRKEVGKDTVADIISAKFGHRKIAFADPLKDTLAGYISDYTSVPKDMDRETAVLIKQCKAIFMAKMADLSFVPGTIELSWHASLWVREKPYCEPLRKALQRLGTEYFRAKDPFYWIKSMHLEPGLPYVITDCRFSNELLFTCGVGAYALHIVKVGSDNDDEHVSETAADEMECDGVLLNTMDGVDKLHGKVMEALAEAGDRLYEKYGELSADMCSWLEVE